MVVAAGAAAGKFLHYEEAAPAVAAQTAYGIEAEVEGYEDSYDEQSMLFMDFRRHHTGVWPNTAPRCVQCATELRHFQARSVSKRDPVDLCHTSQMHQRVKTESSLNQAFTSCSQFPG